MRARAGVEPVDALIGEGRVVAGTRVDLARTAIGVAVREGAPRPHISTPEALRRTLLAAGSVVDVDSARGATSGVHVAAVLEHPGIAEAVRPKPRRWPGGDAAEAVARGRD